MDVRSSQFLAGGLLISHACLLYLPICFGVYVRKSEFSKSIIPRSNVGLDGPSSYKSSSASLISNPRNTIDNSPTVAVIGMSPSVSSDHLSQISEPAVQPKQAHQRFTIRKNFWNYLACFTIVMECLQLSCIAFWFNCGPATNQINRSDYLRDCPDTSKKIPPPLFPCFEDGFTRYVREILGVISLMDFPDNTGYAIPFYTAVGFVVVLILIFLGMVKLLEQDEDMEQKDGRFSNTGVFHFLITLITEIFFLPITKHLLSVLNCTYFTDSGANYIGLTINLCIECWTSHNNQPIMALIAMIATGYYFIFGVAAFAETSDRATFF